MAIREYRITGADEHQILAASLRDHWGGHDLVVGIEGPQQLTAARIELVDVAIVVRSIDSTVGHGDTDWEAHQVTDGRVAFHRGARIAGARRLERPVNGWKGGGKHRIVARLQGVHGPSVRRIRGMCSNCTDA